MQAGLPMHVRDNDPAQITTKGVTHQLTKLNPNMLKIIMLLLRNNLT